MIGPLDKNATSTDISERCRAATEAYATAAQALNAGHQRETGPTPSELKGDFDARIELRATRAAYLEGARRFTALSKAELRASQRAHSHR